MLTKKQAKEQRSAAEELEIKIYLRQNDKQFWVNATSFKEAIAGCPRKISVAKLKNLMVDTCRFWKSPEIKRRAFTAKQWDRLAAVAAEYAELLNEKDSSIEFCAKFLRSLCVIASPSVLMNSSAFHRVTNGRFRPVKEGE